MLTYQAGTSLSDPFGDLLAADLDDDARACYERTASDIAVVAAGADQPLASVRAMRTLLAAMAAAPALRPGSWRRLHRDICTLLSGARVETVPDPVRPEFVRALGRLRQFLAENTDLRDGFGVDGFSRCGFEQVGA